MNTKYTREELRNSLYAGRPVSYTHLISKAAMLIGYWEFFWLGMFGIVICGSMSAERPYKGLVSGMAGLLISCIGIDGIYGGTRFAFGVTGLKAGISLVPVSYTHLDVYKRQEFQVITALCRNARKEVERILSNCA